MKYVYSKNEFFCNHLNISYFEKILNSNKKLFNHPSFDKYIDNWKAVLVRLYISEKDRTIILNQGQYYYEPIFFDDDEIRLHINIDLAYKRALVCKCTQIPLKYFSSSLSAPENTYVKYSFIPDLGNTSRYQKSNEPIILVIFNQYGYEKLVIDGNHRVSAKVNSSVEIINAKELSLNDVLCTMISDFEKAIYTFLYEGYLLSKGDFSIINKSNYSFFI